jgi:hypothetical protein
MQSASLNRFSAPTAAFVHLRPILPCWGSELTRHPPSHKFSHAYVAWNDFFDCVQACSRPVHQDACGGKWLITQKLRYNLHKVTQRSSWSVFVIKGKVVHFEALTSKLNCQQTSSGFSHNSNKFSIYHLVSLPLQEEEFHCAALLMYVAFDWVNVIFDFW